MPMSITRIRIAAATAIFWMMLLPDCMGQSRLQLSCSVLSTENGLSRGYITGILQDADGFLWIGTSSGLNRYDGYSFHVFRHNAADSSSISGDDVSCMYEDRQHRLWIGTRDQGLDLYDRTRMRFIHIRKDSLNRTITGIAEDKEGVVYVVTASGLAHISRLRGQKFRLMPIALPPGFEDALFLKKLKLFTANDGILRIAARKAVASLQWDGRSGRPVFIIEHDFSFVQHFNIDHIRYDSQDNALLIFNGSSIMRCSNNRGATQLELLATAQHNSEGFCIDAQTHCLWYISAHMVYRMNLDDGKRVMIDAASRDAQEILQSPLNFYIDRGHNLWIGSSGYGLLRCSPSPPAFRHVLPDCNAYCIIPVGKDGFCVNVATRVCIKRDGSDKIDTLASLAFFVKQIAAGRTAFSAATDTIHFYLQIPGGIGIYDAVTHKLARYTFEQTEALPAPSPLHYDGKSAIWSCYDNFLVRFDLTTHDFLKYPLPQQPPVMSLQFVHCFLEDTMQHKLWMGTALGLFAFDEQKALWSVYPFDPGKPAYPPRDAVYALCADKENARYLWAGSSGRGLYHFNKATGNFSPATALNAALTDGIVYNILSDGARNQLWLSTNSGLYCYTSSTGAWRNYTRADGLQGVEFNRYAACITRSGKMVFGGLHGINYFDPSEVVTLSPPSVIITGLRLFNKPVDIANRNAPLREDIAYARSLRLSYRQEMITFVFAATDYREPDLLRYRYRLQGFDTGWIDAGASHEATYTNLDAGTYSFSVQARYANGIWGKASAPLALRITPPWWRTWWALFSFITAFFAGLYLLYRFRIRQLSKIDQMRSNIARDLHDDIGSMLSTISIYAKVAQQVLNDDVPRTKSMLEKITSNAANVMEAMNEIIWSINVHRDDFESLTSRMREHAAELFDATQSKWQIEFGDDVNTALRQHLPVEKWKDFYLLYKEALNNILKYADARHVTIKLGGDGSHLLLTIKDDGRGFNWNQQQRTGNGLKNMAARAAAIGGVLDIQSAPGKGTSLSLRI